MQTDTLCRYYLTPAEGLSVWEQITATVEDAATLTHYWWEHKLVQTLCEVPQKK